MKRKRKIAEERRWKVGKMKIFKQIVEEEEKKTMERKKSQRGREQRR